MASNTTMLSLDQVRAVNDGFKSGDLNAALKPLEETIDLRPTELPRLDKAALAALKSGLQNGDDAKTWAQAVFHPNVSVRRFARRVFMGMGDEAAPLFQPLRGQIERFWSEAVPLPETSKPREAALRREQRETVSSALELLLRSNPEGFLEFFASVADATPLDSSDGGRGARDWQERNRHAWEKTREETDRLLGEEWGEEFLAPDKRWKLPSRVLRELDERARQNPEVARLWNELGDNPFERAALEWQPIQLLTGTWSEYVTGYNATGPTKRVAARLRPVFLSWIETAFDFERNATQRAPFARRFLVNHNTWGLASWLGKELLQEQLPALLLRTKSDVLTPLQSLLKSKEGLYRQTDYQESELFAALWLSLAWAVGNSIQKPYNQKLEEWPLPAVEPATLRELSEGLKASKATEHVLTTLQNAAKELDAAKLAQSRPAPVETEVEVPPVFGKKESIFDEGDALLAEQIERIYAKAQDTDDDAEDEKAQAKAQKEVKRVEAEVAVLNDDEKVARLIAPPHPRDPNKTISRMPYWKVWSRDLGENGAQKLKSALWERVEPKLWAAFELKLEEYRRMETDAVEPKIEQKLTERELKEWRAQTRRDKRTAIARELSDIANLLIEVDGLPARLKAIEVADRPSCRDVRDQFELGLFYELEKYPGFYSSPDNTLQAWQEWKLGEEWDAILAKMETRLGEAKDEWRRTMLERQLAAGFYRRGDFEKFRDYATRPNAFAPAVAAAAVAFDDFEAWRILMSTNNCYGPPAVFWKAQLGDETRKTRALEAVVSTLASTSEEGIAKMLLGWLAPLAPAEFEPFLTSVENALESALVPVKRWAMNILGAFKTVDFDRERAVQSASESLWHENAGLAKDAAKFLSQLALQNASVVEVAWEALNDATALENVAVSEAVYRALAQVKAKNQELVLGEAAREKLEQLAQVQSERFGKFEKKLG